MDKQPIVTNEDNSTDDVIPEDNNLQLDDIDINDIDIDDIDIDDDLTLPSPEFNLNAEYMGMIKDHMAGDDDSAADKLGNIISHKTSQILSGWYNVSGSLSSHLSSSSEKQ